MARTSLVLLVLAAIAAGCGGNPPAGGDDTAEDGGSDGSRPDESPDAGPGVDAGVDAGPVDYPYSDLDVGCAPIFRQNVVTEYHLTIPAEHWAAMQHEFMNPQFTPGGSIIEPGYHPTQLRIVAGSATHDPPGVMVRINGNTSWLQTIRYDENPKMQFMIAFNEVDGDARFQDLRKVKLDMPRGDWTYLQQRVALAWMRGRAGVPAQCANSARVFINGSYYGLFTNVERQDKGFLKRIYGSANNDGDLWKAGRDIKTNEETFSWTHISAFWDVETLPAIEALVDVETSLFEWVSEAVIGDSDGYNQGRPNYLLYDHPATGQFVWLANDLDTTLDEDFLPPDTSPVFAPTPEGEARWERDWHHYLIGMNDPALPPRYVQAMAAQLAKLDPAELAIWIDDWRAQIADAAAADPRRPFTMDDHEEGLERMKEYSPARVAYLDRWVDCWSNGGVDADGDGFDMCRDCKDSNAAQSPAAVEVCDEVDNNCDGYVDNVAAGSPACTADPEAAAREAFWRRVNTDVKARAKADRLAPPR
jgi:hypothetical protein